MAESSITLKLGQQYAVVLGKNIEKEVEKNFEDLLGEGKDEDKVLECLWTLQRSITHTTLSGKSKQSKQLKKKAISFLPSKNGIILADFIGIRESTWLNSIGKLIGNVKQVN